MFSERHETLLPFPEVPEAIKAGFPIGNLALRRFGLEESDLGVDFQRTPHPFLVTAILERCTVAGPDENIDQKFFWNLSVGKRIECLLNLIASGESAHISLQFRCPANACGQESEAELTLGEISELQASAYSQDRVEIEIEDSVFAFRRPTGYDQLKWLNSRFAAEQTAIREMLETLRIPSADSAPRPFTERTIAAVGEAMDECDPLVHFTLRMNCPHCGEESLCEIDLEALSLAHLRQAQLGLISSVHRLAARYHWSEAEIFAVPYWRRASYLKLIESEKH